MHNKTFAVREFQPKADAPLAHTPDQRGINEKLCTT
jgi:hypothetical protein